MEDTENLFLVLFFSPPGGLSKWKTLKYVFGVVVFSKGLKQMEDTEHMFLVPFFSRGLKQMEDTENMFWVLFCQGAEAN